MAHEMHINFKFSKWKKHFSMKKVMLNFCNGYLILQSLNEAFSCLEATSDCVTAAGLTGP